MKKIEGREFRRAQAFRRNEAEAVSHRDWFGKKFGFHSGGTATENNCLKKRLFSYAILILLLISAINHKSCASYKTCVFRTQEQNCFSYLFWMTPSF